jgi:hypothetical protein
VTAADVADRDGAAALLGDIGGAFPRLSYGWVDQSYRGPFIGWVRQTTGIRLQVVPPPGWGHAPDLDPGGGTAPGGAALCGGAPAVGRGADFRLAGPVSPAGQGL